ncbi:unnamed protein product [Arabis nemorensis]|uniref:DUF4283 domain-containing protein n=1 Tax=Arabis nemorensis TaxID=586526 RepID=A0A565AN58_9BRAS|nr:unnamed protein product [Arabis nemorensis]
MAYFGKMVAPRDGRKRLSLIKMPDFDDSVIFKQFERTLVGQVLNPSQAHRVKALLAFLPSLWKCEDRVRGLEMGKGRFQFWFENESDLQQVMTK